MYIHPKTSGAATFGALGVLIVAVLQSLNLHLAPEVYAAIPSFLATLGAWLIPSPPAPRPAPAPAPPPRPVPPAPPGGVSGAA